MTLYPRYGLYFVPPHESGLYRFGAGLLGYDAFTGQDVPYAPAILDAAPDWPDLTRAPRVYGFHATLKAPLSLAPGRHEDDLQGACETLAGRMRAIPRIEPILKAVDDFLAIVPREGSAALDQLAGDCVETLDHFRAPLTDHDRARRKPAMLTERQNHNLERWGYPYVMGDFRFHMTLTGRLPLERQASLLSLLQERFLHLSLSTLPVDRLALCRQDSLGANFRVLSEWPLAAAQSV